MRKDEFVMRGKTLTGGEEVLNFSGFKPGYAYRLVEFQIYPSTNIGAVQAELAASITAAKTAEDPSNPNFNNQGLIATTFLTVYDTPKYPTSPPTTVINDTFLITQNLILAVKDNIAGSDHQINWQCKFMPVKMGKAEEAVTNYKQFMISDD